MKEFVFYLKVFVCIFPVFLSSDIHGMNSIKLGTDDWPPYEIEEKGKITGFCTEIIYEVFRNMEVDISENNIYPWARAEKMLSRGTIDALYSTSKSSKSEKTAFFPHEPLINSKWVFFVRTEDLMRIRFRSFKDLKGKTGVVREYSYTPELWEFLKKNNNYETVSSDKTLFKMLAFRRIRYLVSEYKVGYYIVKKLGLKGKIASLEHPLKSTGLYIIFSRKNVNKKFVVRFSKTLKRYKKGFEYKRLLKKYFQDYGN